MNHLKVHQWLLYHNLVCKLKNLRFPRAQNASTHWRLQKGWSVRSNSTQSRSHQQSLHLFQPFSQWIRECCDDWRWFDLSLLQTQKIGILQVAASRKMLVIRIVNHPLYPLSCPPPITITSITSIIFFFRMTRLWLHE